MAYGTLTLQTEDGDRQVFSLEKTSTTVGRQSTNDIVLNTTSASRYHARFDIANGQVYVVDLESSHGTFVNDRQIAPEQPILLNHGDAITIGEVRLTYLSAGRALVSLIPSTETIQAEGVPFRMMLDQPLQSVAPGARLQLALLIENLSEAEANYRVVISGEASDWSRANRQDVLLEAGEQTEVMITVRPPRNYHSLPGRYKLAVRLYMSNEPELALDASREIDIVGYSGFGMVMQPGIEASDYRIGVQNYGNLPLRVAFAGYDRGQALQYQFKPPSIDLAPGAAAQVALSVSERRRIPSGEVIEFAALAGSQDAAAFTAPVRGLYRGGSSRRGLWLAGLGLPVFLFGAMLIALVIGGLAWMLWTGRLGGFSVERAFAEATGTPTLIPSPLPPTPSLVATAAASITRFEVSPEEAFYRTATDVVFTWDYSGDVTGLSLFRLDTGEDLLSADAISVRQSYFSAETLAAGEHSFRLTITGTDGQPRSETLTVRIRHFRCASALDGPAALFNQPGGDPLNPQNLDGYVIIGRSADLSWLAVELDPAQPPAWARFEALDCPWNLAPVEIFPILGG